MQNHRSEAKRVLAGVSLAVLLIALAACASQPSGKPSAGKKSESAAAAASAPIASSNAQLPGFRIKDWSAPDDHTVIVVSDDGTRYRAETMGPCLGLNFATRLAFVNRGGFEQVDRYSSVVLGDGTRCALQSFDKLQAPESKALDSYEKSGEKDGKDGEKAEDPKPAQEDSANPK
jgi:hypothetical protein